MIITGQKVSICIGVLAISTSLFGIIGNLAFNDNYSYVSIGLGMVSGVSLLSLYLNKKCDVKQYK
jgi:hypothetical protein